MGKDVTLGRWGPERGMDTPLVISIKDPWGLSPAQKVGVGGGVVPAGGALVSLSLMELYRPLRGISVDVSSFHSKEVGNGVLTPPRGVWIEKKSSDPGLKGTADREAQPDYRVWNYLIFSSPPHPPP